MHFFLLYFFFRYSHTAHVVNDHLVLVGGVSPNSTHTPGVVLLNLKSLTWKSFSLPVSAFLLSQYSTVLAKIVHDLTTRLKACLYGGWGPQLGEVTCGGSPHLSCKRDQVKMRDYMDRRVTHQSGLPHLPVVPEPAHTITQEKGSGSGVGGPDPAFPLLFYYNPTSRTAVISIQDTGSFLGLPVVSIQSCFDTSLFIRGINSSTCYA